MRPTSFPLRTPPANSSHMFGPRFRQHELVPAARDREPKCCAVLLLVAAQLTCSSSSCGSFAFSFFLWYFLITLCLCWFSDEFFKARIGSLVGVAEPIVTPYTRQLSCSSTFAEAHMAEEVAVSRREERESTRL